MNHTNRDNCTKSGDSLSSKAFMVLSLVVHMKSSCVKNEERDLEREIRTLFVL